MSVPIERFSTIFFRDGSLSQELNQDGSTTPVLGAFTVPSGFTFHIHSFRFVLVSRGRLRSRGFGDSNNPLTNGLFVDYLPNGEVTSQDFPVGLPPDNPGVIKDNAKFASFMKVEVVLNDRMMVAVWAASDFCSGRPLAAAAGDKFTVHIQDDLTDLDFFRVSAAGIWIGENDNPASFALDDIRNI